MKKLGYTLAEVLITLSIVGVVAALIIPTFVSDSRNKANASKLSAVISATENALTSMMASEGVNDIVETIYYTKIADSEKKEAMVELSKYLKISSSEEERCVTKNGAVLSFTFEEEDIDEATANSNGYTSLGSIATLNVDVNGSAKPNKPGRDQFLFKIGKSGSLYPAGGKIYTLFVSGAKTWDKTGDFACSSSKVTLGCTARLIDEGFQVNY